MAGLAPTGRAAFALALVALSALVLPVWVSIALAIMLVGAVLADATAVRSPPRLERRFASVLSRGIAAPLVVRASSGDERRVLLRQPALPGLGVSEGVSESGELRAVLLARRRGRFALPAVACASVGPLRLARVHHRSGEPEPLRVYPDLVSAHGLIARLRRQLSGHHTGLARGPLGLGTDFESVRDYTPDDDIRQLNWRATARMGRPMSNQYRVERDRDLICLIDAGRLTAAPIGPRTILDVALDCCVLLAIAADELGDRCGAIAFDETIRSSVAPRHMGARHVTEALFDLEPRLVDSDFELAFARVGGSRRGLVLVFTDLVDEAAARSLLAAVPMLARRHALIVASPVDPLLQRLASADEGSVQDLAAAVVARDVLATRARTSARLARAGALVIESAAEQLPERCLNAYLRVKARVAV